MGTATPVTGVIDPIMGPCVSLPGGSVSAFAANNSIQVSDNKQTLAAILSLNSSGSAQMAMATGTTNAQGYTMFFGSGTSGGVHITQITTPLTSTYHLVPGVPHFVGASVGPAGQNIVIVNLATGQTYSYTSTNSGTSNTPGEVGSGYMGSQSTQFCINGKMAAGMMSGTYLTLQQVEQWAADPWSFWYPDNAPDQMLVGMVSQQHGSAHDMLLMGIGN